MEFLIGLPLVLVAIVVIWWISTHNRFIKVKNHIRESWSNIDVNLKRRRDLIPNLIETVRGIMDHENAVFTKLAELRDAGVRAQTRAEVQETESQIGQLLGGIFARSEAYPQLQSSQNFQELQRELSDTEDRIAAARRFFNGNVRELNTMVASFPSSLIAKSGGHSAEDFFELDDPADREPVQVKF